MSYYAHRSGELELTKYPRDILEELYKKYTEYNNCIDLDVFIRDKYCISVDDTYYCKEEDRYYLCFSCDERYDEDSYIEMLEELAEYIVQPADINFEGEDGSVWKITLNNNEASVCNGSIVYDDELPTHITVDDVKRFIQTDAFNRLFKEINDPDGLYITIRQKLEDNENYWTKDKLKELLFAIALTDCQYKGQSKFLGADCYLEQLLYNQRKK